MSITTKRDQEETTPITGNRHGDVPARDIHAEQAPTQVHLRLQMTMTVNGSVRALAVEPRMTQLMRRLQG